VVPDAALSADPVRWPADGVVWRAQAELPAAFAWSGTAVGAETSDPRTRAMADLCHVLLNSNEFIYLH